MYCKQCGNLFLDGDKFCRNCGHYQVKSSVERSAFEPVHIEYVDRSRNTYKIELGDIGSRVIATILVIIVFPLFILGFGSTPSIESSPKDIMIYRAAMSCVIFFAFLMPSILLLLWSFRAKISFMRRLKGWHLILIVAVMMLIGGLGAVFIGSFGDQASIVDEATTSIETAVSDSQDQAAVIAPTEVPIIETERDTTAPAEHAWTVDLELALNKIGIDPSVISTLTQKEKSADGAIYMFFYKNTRFVVCFDSDGAAESIALGDITLYRRGFEPLPAEDYIVDSDAKNDLQARCLEDLTAQPATPDTADFPMLDWSIGHCGDIYFVSGVESSQDAGGEKRDLPFRAEYEKDGGTYKLVYLVLDGADVVGSGSLMEIPELKPMASEG